MEAMKTVPSSILFKLHKEWYKFTYILLYIDISGLSCYLVFVIWNKVLQ